MLYFETVRPQELLNVGLAVVQFPMMGVAAHTEDVIEGIPPIERYQSVGGFGQQCLSYITAPLFEVEVANHADVRVGALLTGFIPREVWLPVLDETQYSTTLCRQVRLQPLEDRLAIQFVLKKAGLPLGG